MMTNNKENKDMFIQAMLKQAVDCEAKGEVLLSKHYYQRFLENLKDMAKRERKYNPSLAEHLLIHIAEYTKHMENMAIELEDTMACSTLLTKHVYQLDDENRTSMGLNYKILFDQYFDESVKEVLIEMPNLCQKAQFKNLIKFLEVPNRNCPNLRYIGLVTKLSSRHCCNQKYTFRNIRKVLAKHNIIFDVHFTESVEQQRIYLSSGHMIRSDGTLGLFDRMTAEMLDLNDDCDDDINMDWYTQVSVWKCPSVGP